MQKQCKINLAAHFGWLFLSIKNRMKSKGADQMKKKLALLSLAIITLSACAPAAIDPENGEDTAAYLKDVLEKDVDLELTQVEYGTGIADVYELGVDTRVVLDDEQGVSQIEFDQLNAQEVQERLALIDFPESTTIETALSEASKNELLRSNYYFTEYQGIGALIMGDLDATAATPNPYRLIIIYDEDRFEKLEASDID